MSTTAINNCAVFTDRWTWNRQGLRGKQLLQLAQRHQVAIERDSAYERAESDGERHARPERKACTHPIADGDS